MKKFKEHEFTLNIGTVKRVRDILNVDLTQPEKGEPPLIARIFDDDLFFVELLGEIIPDLDIESLTGEEVTQALAAFMEEWRHFFILRGRTDRAKMVTVIIQTLKEVINTTEQELGKAFTDSQESQESTPSP